MRLFGLILIVALNFRGTAQINCYSKFYPLEIARSQSANFARQHVTRAVFITTVNKEQSRVEKWYDHLGRDTISFTNGKLDYKATYVSDTSAAIETSFNNKGLPGGTYKRKTEYVMNELYDYDEKGRIKLVYLALDTCRSCPDTVPTPKFGRLFGPQPTMDSIHFVYDSRGRITSEDFIVKHEHKERNYHAFASFRYNRKGLLKEVMYGNIVWRIKYKYRR
jgi:hypothetical protein